MESELEARLEPLRMEFGLAPWEEITSATVVAALDAQIAEARGFREQIESDLRALDEPQGRRRLLNDLAAAEAEQENEDDLFAAMLGMVETLEEPPWEREPGKGRRGKRGRNR